MTLLIHILLTTLAEHQIVRLAIAMGGRRSIGRLRSKNKAAGSSSKGRKLVRWDGKCTLDPILGRDPQMHKVVFRFELRHMFCSGWLSSWPVLTAINS